jgi:maltose alpha-D-glucosyltransferase / alpha-amylase
MKKPGSASDPLWYKDAVIYELHVRAFADSNNDGIGDLPGLTARLDYLQDLGVTCVWLLPFFPSPLRDDGYDISDYLNVHPDYGTIEDFQTFLTAAHDRGLQVMIELVVNHTSDRHAWFQRAREAPAGSAERDFYVWSDTDQKYKDVRIIFTDTEKSNWTWDPVAKAYYWHRFFSHQPDLNFDNPAVLDEVLRAMRFWLDMGVDGLRLDAIPYLVERDGTSSENLPETHAIIKRIRAAMDEEHANRVILAEANQWPSDVRPYFGDGDECHMAFHFPLMPRIFMALRLEDGLPITEILAQTPEIPPSCQWALFLRNHDELTLEMVTTEERDYMYLAYSADPRMRLNIGIRRRLAPLMDNNRRRIELLNSLLFSFPGTPILYYGDEIGMGDNIYLGDRNGVRTPMQWNSDRNAGFSRATPSRLYSPVIMDPVYGYQTINVEAQQSDPSSLLHWMRNMIALRKLFRVFGRGSIEFLGTANRKVLAYVRRHESEAILCVANLSRFAQPVELDLSAFEGMRPVEMLGYVEFPVITRRPYSLTPGPYGFMWFELQGTAEPIEVRPEDDVLSADEGWTSLFSGLQRERFEAEVLPRFLPHQRWFGGKARRIQTAEIRDWVEFDGAESALILLEVEYASGPPDTYFVPLAMTFGRAPDVPAHAILAALRSRHGAGVLYDATYHEPTRAAFLAWIADGRTLRTHHGVVTGSRGAAFAELRGDAAEPFPVVRAAGEQSNTSLVYGDRLILKIVRKQLPGINPDVEVGRYLTDHAHFPHIASVAGTIDYTADRGESSTLALLQALIPNQGDGWTWTLEELERYYQECSLLPVPPDGDRQVPTDIVQLSDAPMPPLALERMGLYLDAAATLGRRTAELHLALASPTDDPAFAPEPLTIEDLQQLATELESSAARAFEGLKDGLSALPDAVVESAGLVLSRRRRLLESFRQLAAQPVSGLRTRVHGDYHLGQVVRVKNDYAILDFEGEPARTLAERRAKHSPLKDVAGMLQSFSYAAWVSLAQFTTRGPDAFARLEPWARLWEQSASAAFLRAYRDTATTGAFLPADPAGLGALLDAYVLDKAFYEVMYELNNRPAWVWIPLRRVLTYPV